MDHAYDTHTLRATTRHNGAIVHGQILIHSLDLVSSGSSAVAIGYFCSYILMSVWIIMKLNISIIFISKRRQQNWRKWLQIYIWNMCALCSSHLCVRPSLEITGAMAQICSCKATHCARKATHCNKKSITGRNNLLSKCACGDTSQRYNKLHKFSYLLWTFLRVLFYFFS